jgi:NitT/TauT family transport system substrate-binding protein
MTSWSRRVPKVPVRYDLLMQGQLKAAALPEPLLSLAEFEGATLLADDTTGENLSQTVLVFSDEYLSEIGGVDTMSALLEVWDAGAEIVNEDPDAWRDLLVEQARLPEPIKDTYRINSTRWRRYRRRRRSTRCSIGCATRGR